MKVLGNLIWWLFGGLEAAIGYFTGSLATDDKPRAVTKLALAMPRREGGRRSQMAYIGGHTAADGSHWR